MVSTAWCIYINIINFQVSNAYSTFQYQSKYNTLLVFIILQNMYFILKIVCKENSYSFTCTVWLSHCDLITFSAPVFQCVSCSKKIFALCLRRKSKTSFLCLNSPKPFVLNVTIFSSSQSPMTKFTVDNNTWVTVEGGCGEGAFTMTDSGREWTKHTMHVSRQWLVKLGKVQATTSSESAKCSFSSVHRELTEASNKDTPCGATWADHQRARSSVANIWRDLKCGVEYMECGVMWNVM